MFTFTTFHSPAMGLEKCTLTGTVSNHNARKGEKKEV